LLDPVPGSGTADDGAQASGDSDSAEGQRRQVGDGAVLVDPGAAEQFDEATEQARRNEARQQGQEVEGLAVTDGAVLVGGDRAVTGSNASGDGAVVDGDAR
jgi:hypothetical protein